MRLLLKDIIFRIYRMANGVKKKKKLKVETGLNRNTIDKYYTKDIVVELCLEQCAF